MLRPHELAGRSARTAATIRGERTVQMKPNGRMLDDLDGVDLGIIRLLQEQGRRPNAQIARDLGVSEPTIRKRIDRMVQDEIIKIVAVLNPRKTGYATDVVIGVRVAPGNLMVVGEALAEFDEVVYLGYTSGRYDVLVEMLFRTDEDLFRFVTERAPKLDGLLSTETYHVLRTGKINYDWKLPTEFDRPRPLPDADERHSVPPERDRVVDALFSERERRPGRNSRHAGREGGPRR